MEIIETKDGTAYKDSMEFEIITKETAEAARDLFKAKNEQIEAQEQEIDRLKVELNDIKILKMAMENGEIDMTIESPKAKLLLASIVQIFRQNGAKNYYTVDLSDAETNESFSVTIQNNKGLSPAQILNEKDEQIKALTADKDEQAGRIMQFEKLAKDLYFAYINKDPDCPHDFEIKAVERYHALLGGGGG